MDGDRTRSLDMCPDWDQRPFGIQMTIRQLTHTGRQHCLHFQVRTALPSRGVFFHCIKKNVMRVVYSICFQGIVLEHVDIIFKILPIERKAPFLAIITLQIMTNHYLPVVSVKNHLFLRRFDDVPPIPAKDLQTQQSAVGEPSWALRLEFRFHSFG